MSIKDIAKKIEENGKVLMLTGAGISCACGIPDFRSPKSGLYDNLQSYNLPFPTLMFTIDYFRMRPRPFYKLIGNLFPETPY